MKDEIINKINYGKKAYFRDGKVLKSVLLQNKEIVSGEDALLVFNTYGISPRELIILFLSHGLEMDVESFSNLLENQQKQKMNYRQCNGRSSASRTAEQTAAEACREK